MNNQEHEILYDKTNNLFYAILDSSSVKDSKKGVKSVTIFFNFISTNLMTLIIMDLSGNKTSENFTYSATEGYSFKP